MSEPFCDNTLDARLRDVPLPPDLLARLRSVSEVTDGELDAMLRGGPIPAGFRRRLRGAVADELLDTQLRSVPLPRGLIARLRILPTLRPRRPLARLAVAASLMLLVGSLHLAALAGLIGSVRPGRRLARETLYIDHGPLHLEASAAPAVSLQWPGQDGHRSHDPRADGPFASGPFASGPFASGPFAAGPFASGPFAAGPFGDGDLHLVSFQPAQDGPADWTFAGLGDSGNWWTDVLRMRWGPLGAPQVGSEELPELDASPQLDAVGVEPPPAAGADRLFFLRHGVHPPLFPGRDERLQTINLPLTAETTSLERCWQLLGEGRLPRSDQVRVEDFLAGVPQRFDVADTRPPTASPIPDAPPLGLRAAAGPNFFGDDRAGLLLLSVVATAEVPRSSTAPASAPSARHLTVALDISDSMRFGHRLARVRQALQRLLPSLGPRDRLSLVAFNQEIVWVVEQAGVHDIPELREVFDNLRAGGGTNLSAGLQQAVSLAMEPTLSADDAHGAALEDRQLVVVTDGRAGMPRATREAVRQMLTEATQQGLTLRILDMGDERIVDPQLSELAAATGGHVRKVATADQVHWNLLEALTGNSSVVAEDALLSVRFNPEVVAAYRLVGHEASSLALLSPAELPATLRVGQATGALLEIWLRPGSADLVGWAELEWRDPRTGERDHLRQRISRLQFAASFDEAPLSLQAAGVAAETAELLRGSYRFELEGLDAFRAVSKPDDWDGLLRRAEAVHPVLGRHPEFERMVELIRRVVAVRRGGA